MRTDVPQNIPFDTHARRLLVRFLKKTVMTQAAFAKRVGVCQQTVSDWLKGKTRPESIILRAVVERVADVPRDAWLMAEERRRIKAA